MSRFFVLARQSAISCSGGGDIGVTNVVFRSVMLNGMPCNRIDTSRSHVDLLGHRLSQGLFLHAVHTSFILNFQHKSKYDNTYHIWIYVESFK